MTSIPATMRAMRAVAHSQLEEQTLPVPQPGPGEVLVKVASSSVNPVDYKVFESNIGLEKPHPFTPGCDVSGTVVAIGDNVKDFQVGDEVFGMTGSLGHGPQGTLAEYAIGWQEMLAKKPSNLSLHDAAAVPLTVMTAWEGLMYRIHLKPTYHVLVTGASGGVGQIAIQIAKSCGATVYGLASEGKRDLVEQHGAIFIDYKAGPAEVERVAKEKTAGGRGFDVCYESIGGEWLSVCFNVVCAHGAIATINAFEPYDLTRAATKGIMLCFPLTCLPFLYPDERNRRFMGSMLREALPLLESGKLRVTVDEGHKFPFTKDGVLQAYDTIKHCRNRGKIVIDVAPK